MEGVTVYGHLPECHVTFGEGNVVLFNEIPILPRNFLRDDFKRSWIYHCPRNVYESCAALRVKHSYMNINVYTYQ